jgi:gluconate 2-dehydrogenase gamma chain
MKSRRREFLAAVATSTVACGGHLSPWRFLTQEEANTLAAICSRIIPADRDPGAAEAGAVDFIDRQLSGFYQEHQNAYREGISGIDRTSVEMSGAPFVKLDAAQQTAVLKALEKKRSPFVDLVVTHTMQGYYGSPRHGGNRDAVSWKMLGVPYPPVRGRA